MRWEVDGEIFDSRFEYQVYDGLRKAGLPVRRTGEQDSMVYQVPVRGGLCTNCESNAVVSTHSYTPDLFVGEEAQPARRHGQSPAVPAADYYIEAKGYLRADRRSLLRYFRKARPDIDLRLVVQRDYIVSRKSGLTIIGWAKKYLKCPVTVWTGGSLTWQ